MRITPSVFIVAGLAILASASSVFGLKGELEKPGLAFPPDEKFRNIEPGSRVRVEGRMGTGFHPGTTKQNLSPFPRPHFIYMDVDSVTVLGDRRGHPPETPVNPVRGEDLEFPRRSSDSIRRENAASRADIKLGRGERLISGNPTPKAEWSAADRALREAMEVDPTYTTGAGNGLTQKAAIAGWRRFLERDDVSRHQRAFAWWRIGSLYAYNCDASRGEMAEHERAEEALARARELFGDLVPAESLNCATVWATIAGPEKERAKRLATAFNWLFTRDENDIQRSAELINRNGFVIDKKFFPEIARRETTVAQRSASLRDRLHEHQAIITKAAAEYVQYAQDRKTVTQLLKSIEGVADPGQMEQWRGIVRRPIN